MPNPQQPELRRTERTAVTNEPAPEATDPKSTRSKGHAHGTDKGQGRRRRRRHPARPAAPAPRLNDVEAAPGTSRGGLLVGKGQGTSVCGL